MKKQGGIVMNEESRRMSEKRKKRNQEPRVRELV